MKSEYELIFDQRGRDYDQAMKQFPTARDNEFLRLFDHVSLNDIQLLADIPSGGGYLDKFIPSSCIIDAIEPCQEFQANKAHSSDIGLDDIELPSSHYDAVICLAAIHHVKDKNKFIRNLYKALKPGGYLLLGDVFIGNSITDFLDNFAGQHNGTGHSGMYLNSTTASDILIQDDAQVINIEEKACPWVFNNQQDMLKFCRLLFGLKSVDDDLLLDALFNKVGVKCDNEHCQLNWSLLYHTIKKRG